MNLWYIHSELEPKEVFNLFVKDIEENNLESVCFADMDISHKNFYLCMPYPFEVIKIIEVLNKQLENISLEFIGRYTFSLGDYQLVKFNLNSLYNLQAKYSVEKVLACFLRVFSSEFFMKKPIIFDYSSCIEFCLKQGCNKGIHNLCNFNLSISDFLIIDKIDIVNEKIINSFLNQTNIFRRLLND